MPAFAVIFTIGVPSAGLLKLRRPVRVMGSSAVLVALRLALKALTVTGTTDRFGTAGFENVGKFCALEAVDFDAAMVVTEDALDDCSPCDCESGNPGPEVEVADVGASDDRFDPWAGAATPLSRLGSWPVDA